MLTSRWLASASRTNAMRPRPGTAYSLRALPSTATACRRPLMRPERRGVAVVAADLAAGRQHVSPGALARVERQPLHRVQVHLEAGEPARDALVEPARAGDHARRARDAHSPSLEPGEVPLDRCEHLRIAGERLALVLPALARVAVRARLPQRLRTVERQRLHQGLRSLRVPPAHSPHDGPRPCLAQERISVGDELLRVIQPRPHGAPRPPLRLLRPLPRGDRRDGGDDERPEPRPQAILVNPEDDAPFHPSLSLTPRRRPWKAAAQAARQKAEPELKRTVTCCPALTPLPPLLNVSGRSKSPR